MKIALILGALFACAAALRVERQHHSVVDNILNHVHINVTQLKQDVQMVLDIIGSDPTEQACENEVHKLFHAGLLYHSAGLFCHGFQELVKHFRLVPLDPAVGKRYVLDSFGKFGLNVSMLQKDLQILVDTLGSDPTEQACEQELHKLFHDGLLFHSAPLICHSFQALINHFHIVPTVGKRDAHNLEERQHHSVVDNILNHVHINVTQLKQDVQMVLDIIGSDPTEQACENEVHKLFHAGLLYHSAGLFCHGFQELVKHFRLVPNTPVVGKRHVLASSNSGVQQRSVVDNILNHIHVDATTLKQDVQMVLDIIGSDPTEQACEKEVHKLFHSGLLYHSAPLFCHGFQELVKHWRLVPNNPAVGKRYVLDSFEKLGLNLSMLKQDLQILVDTLGSDPTEQACEDKWHQLFHDGLLYHSAPLMCHSLQAMIHHFNIVPASTGGKRLILDNFVHTLGLNTTMLEQDLQMLLNVLGSDPTEQACEDEVHKLFTTGVLYHSAPLLCHSFQRLVHMFQLKPITSV